MAQTDPAALADLNKQLTDARGRLWTVHEEQRRSRGSAAHNPGHRTALAEADAAEKTVKATISRLEAAIAAATATDGASQ